MATKDPLESLTDVAVGRMEAFSADNKSITWGTLSEDGNMLMFFSMIRRDLFITEESSVAC